MFRDKVILITGAGSGIGKATAFHFAENYANLSLVDIDREALTEVKEICEEFGNKVVTHAVDLTNDTQAKTMVDETVKAFSKIDVLVNCAGICKMGKITDDNFIRDFDRMVQVDLRAVVVVTACAVPALISSKGCIVNITSVSAKFNTRNYLAYDTVKAGLNHFTKTLALDLAPYGIRANNVLPGAVRTNILKDNGMDAEAEEETWKIISNSPALKHLIEVKDVAGMIGYLASDKAKSITGSDFVIDAGMLLTGPFKISN